MRNKSYFVIVPKPNRTKWVQGMSRTVKPRSPSGPGGPGGPLSPFEIEQKLSHVLKATFKKMGTGSQKATKCCL